MRRIGSRATLLIGAGINTATMAAIALAHDSVAALLLAGGILGVGQACALTAMANLASSPPVASDEVGIATGINTVMRTIGMAVGSALSAALLAAGGGSRPTTPTPRPSRSPPAWRPARSPAPRRSRADARCEPASGPGELIRRATGDPPLSFPGWCLDGYDPPDERRTAMATIVMSENVSLDGVVEDPAGDEGFRLGGWVGRIATRPAVAKLALDEALGAEALLLGRRSYEWFAGRWPSRTGELADRLNGLPKLVVSSTLADPDWNNSTVLNGDVVEEVCGSGGSWTGRSSFPAASSSCAL